jgi:hypothetical protein
LGHGTGDGGGFLGVNFSGVVEWCFCGGFCEKRCAERGFLLVSLWWIDGELWCVDGRILGRDFFHFFEIYFCGRGG